MNIIIGDLPFPFHRAFYKSYDDSIFEIIKESVINKENNVKICNAHNRKITVDEYLFEIEDQFCDLFLIHIFYYQQHFFDEYLDILVKAIEILKKSNPSLFVAAFGEPFIANSKNVDFKLLGIDTIISNEIIASVKNILIKISKKNNCIFSKVKQNITKLNKYYDELDGSLSICASTGCNSNCSFCIDCKIQGRWRQNNTQNVLDVIFKEVKLKDLKIIKFADLNFFGMNDLIDKEKYVKEFLPISNLGIPIKLSTRIDCINEQILKKLKELGVYIIFYGIESGSQSVINRFSKGIYISKSIKVLELTYKTGIVPQIGFIFFEPFMQRKQLFKNINFLKKSGQYTFLSFQLIDKLRVFKGTEYAEKFCNDKKIFTEKTFTFDYVFQNKFLQLYYDRWEHFFNSIKNLDMTIRYYLDKLALENFLTKNEVIKQIYKKIMLNYNGIVIKCMEILAKDNFIMSDLEKYYLQNSYETLMLLRCAFKAFNFEQKEVELIYDTSSKTNI